MYIYKYSDTVLIPLSQIRDQGASEFNRPKCNFNEFEGKGK